MFTLRGIYSINTSITHALGSLLGAAWRLTAGRCRLVGQLGQSLGGGLLLAGLLGGAGAFAEEFVAHADANGEDFVVVGAGFVDHAVIGREAELLLGGLLELALGVHPGARLQNLGQSRDNMLGDEILSRIVALVEIDRADDGLHGVGRNEGMRALVA